MAKTIPKFLYKGAVFNISELDRIPLDDKDLKIGKEITVCDNPYVARDHSNSAYDQGDVLDKKKEFTIDGVKYHVHLPMIGVTYDIDTDGLEFKGPFSSQEEENQEWKIDVVPLDHCSVSRVIIGPDSLHSPELVDLGDSLTIRKNIKKILERRQRHLNDFVSELDKLPVRKLKEFDMDSLNMFKTLVGDKGAKYLNASSFVIENVDDAIRYLMAIYYSNNTQRLDFKNLLAIENFRKQLSGNTEIQDLLNIMYMEILSLEEKKKQFEEIEKYTDEKPNIKQLEITISGRKYMMSKVLEKLIEELDRKIENNSDNSKYIKIKESYVSQLNLIS